MTLLKLSAVYIIVYLPRTVSQEKTFSLQEQICFFQKQKMRACFWNIKHFFKCLHNVCSCPALSFTLIQ